jgi:hypothetical protein
MIGDSEASGFASVAIGRGLVSTGNFSVTVGRNATAAANDSAAIGRATISRNVANFTVGTFNEDYLNSGIDQIKNLSDSSRILAIGVGDGPAASPGNNTYYDGRGRVDGLYVTMRDGTVVRHGLSVDGYNTSTGQYETVFEIDENGDIVQGDTDNLPEGSNSLYFTDSRAVTAVENATAVNFSGDVTVNSTFGLSTGTTVNNIKTAVDASSDDALVTEGVVSRTLVNVSSDFATSGDTFYSVDSSASEVTVTLSTADAVNSNEIHVKRIGSNSVFVDTEGSQTIDGSSQIEITQSRNAVMLVYNATENDWEIY